MNKLIKHIIYFLSVLMIWFFASMSSYAADELMQFSNENERERYYQLINELRCPKCQNQNLADSDAPIATDLRNELFRLLQDDYSNTDIIDFMTTRYGEFVLYNPPFNWHTVILWVLPLAVFVVGSGFLLRLILQKKTAPTIELNDEQLEQKISELSKDFIGQADESEDEDKAENNNGETK